MIAQRTVSAAFLLNDVRWSSRCEPNMVIKSGAAPPLYEQRQRAPVRLRCRVPKEVDHHLSSQEFVMREKNSRANATRASGSPQFHPSESSLVCEKVYLIRTEIKL